MADSSVELRGIRKNFSGHAAVDGIDLAVAPGEFLTLLGPSGCGKTTTLNMIAGFIAPDAGEIRLAGRSVVNEPPFRRDIGLVFQDYALFPHLSVAENVAFGLRMRKVSRAEIGRRVQEALALVQLAGLGERRPLQLSGGQRQRVALARALVIRPTVLLLDEPLSNLDQKLREEMRLEITRIQRVLGITTVLVTHDQGEALAVSDRIAVMNRGRIEQIGSPVSVYEEPTSRFVADFIGTTNMFAGTAVADAAAGAPCTIATEQGAVTAVAPQGAKAGQSVWLTVRPEHLERAPDGARDGAALYLTGTVSRHVYLGDATEVHVTTSGGERCLLTTSRQDAQREYGPDCRVRLTAPSARCRVLG